MLTALVSVSAAPKDHPVTEQLRAARSGKSAEAASDDPRRRRPPLESVEALTKHIADLKAYGRKHGIRVKTGYLEAYLYQLQHRSFPNNSVDWSAYVRAAAHRDSMPAVRLGAPIRAAAGGPALNRWEFIGPTNLTPPHAIYFGQGNNSGRVNGVAYDPNTPTTYWVASSGGGVWKSTDSGRNWTFMSQDWKFQETSCIATHPTNSNIVYVGTGDFHGFGMYGFGVQRTTDGGATWKTLGGAQFGNFAVSDIVVDPEFPNTIVVTTGRGRGGLGRVWRSTNGGDTWSQVITAGARWSGVAIGARRSDGNRYYYAVGESPEGEVWRSTDRGATWTRLGLNLNSSDPQLGIDIAASKINPDVAYMVAGSEQKIFKSVDAGVTWSDITNNFPTDNQAGDKYNWSQWWYNYHITTSTNGQTDVIYVGQIDLVQSMDGGSTWRSIGQTYTPSAVTHNDQHCLAINPKNPNEALVGNDGGIYKITTTPASGAVTFATNLGARLGITQFYTLDAHPTDPDRLLGGTQDNATPASLGNLGSWRNVGTGDGAGAAINPLNPNIQFASSQFNAIFRTADQWNSAADISPDWGTDRLPFIGTVTIDRRNPNFVYAGTQYLWRWTDNTATWTPRLGNTELASGNGTISAVVVAPTDSNVIYTGASTGEVFMTRNGGQSWLQINSGLPLLSVRSIDVHPTNPNSILVGLSGLGVGKSHAWRCADTSAATRRWEDIGGKGATALPDVPANSIIFDPANPTRYYAGTDVGVFRSADAGANWENMTRPLGLPNIQVNVVRVVSGTGYLMAATYGRGIWRINPNATATGVQVMAPNGGEVLPIGQPVDIRWVAWGVSPTGNVKIELSRDGGASYSDVIAPQTPNTGTFQWTPSASELGSTLRIRVTSLEDPTLADASDGNFQVVQGSLQVLSPNGGEVVRVGSDLTIRWAATDFPATVPTVKIDLSLDGGSSFTTLFPSVSTQAGQITWRATNPISTTARVRVSAVGYPAFSDTSDADFEIRDQASILLQVPNGGERLVVGEPVNILWSSRGVREPVLIEFSADGGLNWTPVMETENDGAEVWVVDAEPTTTGRLRVVALEDPSGNDMSNGVFIVEAPSIAISSPAASRILLLGERETIRWSSTGFKASDTFDVELSRDGGENWETIGQDVPNTGAYQFTVAGAETADALVRLRSTRLPEVEGESDYFEIAAPQLELINPQGKEKWVIGTEGIIQWSGTVLGSGQVDIYLSRNNGKRWELIVPGISNQGAARWGVRGNPSTKARVKLVWRGAGGGTQEVVSQKPFRIVKPSKKRR